MTQQSNHFRDEFGIIREWVVWLAVFAFGAMAFVFLVVFPRVDPHAPTFPLRVLAAVLAGSLVTLYLLLVGYVNQDAKRRDMGQLLWTLLVMLVPNCLGFLAYFLLRKPLIQYCPQCGDRVEKGFHFCAKCGCELAPTCKYCGQAVQRDFACCPYCGKPLAAQGG